MRLPSIVNSRRLATGQRERRWPQPRVIYEAKPGSPLDGRPARSTRGWPARRPADVSSSGSWCRGARAARGRCARASSSASSRSRGRRSPTSTSGASANPRERFWASRTRSSTRRTSTTFDRLWSCLPYLRPMLTITADTIQYGRDEDGGGCHDLLGTRCDPYVHKLLNGEDFDLCCHSNLVRAVAPVSPDRARRARRAQRVPGDRPHRRGPLLRQAEPGPDGRLHRVLRRDRRALRDLGVPARRSLGAGVGARGAATRSLRAARSASRSGSRPRSCSPGGASPAPSDYGGGHGLGAAARSDWEPWRRRRCRRSRRGRAGRACGKGQHIRMVNTHGTQVVDTWAFSAGDVTEWMSMEAAAHGS